MSGRRSNWGWVVPNLELTGAPRFPRLLAEFILSVAEGLGMTGIIFLLKWYWSVVPRPSAVQQCPDQGAGGPILEGCAVWKERLRFTWTG